MIGSLYGNTMIQRMIVQAHGCGDEMICLQRASFPPVTEREFHQWFRVPAGFSVYRWKTDNHGVIKITVHR